MARVTIKDIAKCAAYPSQQCPEGAQQGGYPISAGVRARVEKTAKELGYSPNILAKPQKSVSNEVAVITPSVINPFYTSLIKGIEQQLWGLRLQHDHLCDGPARTGDGDVVRSLRGRMVAGVIAASDNISDDMLEELVRLKRDSAASVVLADYQKQNDGDICGVFLIMSGGAALAAEYLLQRDTGASPLPPSHLDRRSASTAMSFGKRCGPTAWRLERGNTFLCSGETSFQSGVELSDILLESAYQPTAVAAINDTVASGHPFRSGVQRASRCRTISRSSALTTSFTRK